MTAFERATAAAVPSDFPVLPGTGEALKTLGTEHGLLGLLLAIALGVIASLFWLYMRERAGRDAAIKAVRDEWAKDTAIWETRYIDLQETRIREGREMMTAISANTASLIEMQRTIHDRTNTSAELSTVTREAAAAAISSRQMFSELGQRLERLATDNGRRLEDVSRLLAILAGKAPS